MPAAKRVLTLQELLPAHVLNVVLVRLPMKVVRYCAAAALLASILQQSALLPAVTVTLDTILAHSAQMPVLNACQHRRQSLLVALPLLAASVSRHSTVHKTVALQVWFARPV